MRRTHVVLALCLGLVTVACGGGGGGDGDGGDDTVDAPPSVDAAPPVGCDPSAGAPECNNCLDDDSDGAIDGNDIECTGAIDNDEGSFETDIPGDNMDDTWQDCFFDGNSGSGDDGCRFHTCCMYDPDCPDDPNSCDASQECIDFCAPLTPPNCDCFGCCTMCDDAGCVDIYINPAVAPNCDGESIHDENACPRCVKTVECGTTCEGTSECDAETPCPDGEFCSNGCCIAVVE